MSNPYLIEGPAVVSFSGGRTSAYLLHEILDAYDGKLPADVIVVFDNTGKEREETLRFVHECGSRWGVHIHWIERRMNDPAGFEEVGFNSCSRNGEPFMELIQKRKYAPNSVARFCSVEMKVRATAMFCRSLGWERWVNAIGLRYDEGSRVLKALARNDTNKERFKAIMPLSKARVTKRDVMRFWLGPTMNVGAGDRPQGFDLELRDYEGNCDLCFLKSRAKKLAVIRENPGAADWWIAAEAAAKQAATGAGGRFVTEYSYADLKREVLQQPHLFDAMGASPDDDDEQDAECGLWCAPDEAA